MKTRFVLLTTALTLIFNSFVSANSIYIDQSHETIVFSAQQLKSYLSKMTSQEYTLTNELSEADIIIGIDGTLPEEAFRIKSTKSVLEIRGGSPRGCMYGVYGLLDQLGCRWPLPGEEYAVVPEIKDPNFNSIDLYTSPKSKGRGIFYIPMNYEGNDLVELVDFMAKTGYNFLAMHAGPMPDHAIETLAKELSLRDMNFEWGGHFLPNCLPRDLFEKHPEYFRMEDGKRTPTYNFCPSSSAALDIIAENATKELLRYKKIPNFDMVHIWGDDIVEHGWCSCPKCKDYSASDQLLLAMNGLAERMPLGETKLAYLVYHATIFPPEKVKPRPEIRLLYAPRERCFKHEFKGCKSNQWYLDKLKGQMSVFGDSAEVFEYYHDNVMFRCMPYPMPQTIGENVETYLEFGMRRIGSAYFQVFGNWAYGMNSYVLAKSLWRGKGSSEDVEEYCTALYGPYGKEMQDYFGRINELVSTTMQTCGYSPFIDLRVAPHNDIDYAKEHASQLAPLVSEYKLDQIQESLQSLIEKAHQPYKKRIEDQVALFKVARLQSTAVYKSLLIAINIEKALDENASKTEKAYVAALIEQVLDLNDRTAEILTNAPKNLSGPHINRTSGVVGGEMIGQLYQESLKYWLDQLKS